ncbi:hypothetical protein [Phormidesmis priestleyi]
MTLAVTPLATLAVTPLATLAVTPLATLAVTPLVIAFLLAACEPSELRPVPVGVGDGGNGGSYSAPAKSAPAQTPLAPLPMLQDPEGNLQDNGVEFVAQNETEALNKCQKQAVSLSSLDTIVSCLGCRRRTKTTNKFIRTLRTEIVPLPPGEPK